MRSILAVATLLVFVLASFAGNGHTGFSPSGGLHGGSGGQSGPHGGSGGQTSGGSGHPTTTSSASNASLNGAYNFTFTGPHDNGWGQSLNCGSGTQFYGGSETRDQSVMGTGNFDGAGNVSGTFTQYGKLDQTSSNATVSCSNTNGNAVYFAPCSGTFTGTYSIQSNGSGTLTLSASGGCPGSGGSPLQAIIQLSGACSSGLNNTFYLVALRSDNSVESSGIGRYTSTC